MQTNTSKSILFITLLLIPMALSAQIGKRKYVTRSGDTTVVVMAGSTGLYGEDAAFLLDSRASEDYRDKHSRYTNLKEAVLETEEVSDIVEVEKKRTNPSSGSLGFRIAQQNIDFLKRDKEAQRIATNNIRRGASVEELTYLYEKFGEVPSYFINGIQVDQKTAAAIAEGDILTRSLKVTNTTTGNPNGEVWYVINSKAFQRLAIDPEAFEQSYANSYQPRPKAESYVEEPRQTAATQQDQILTDQQKQVDELQKQIQALQQNHYPSSERTPATTTRRVENNRHTPEVISFKDSPQERARRARDQDDNTFGGVQVKPKREEEVLRVTNQADDGSFIDPNITDDTPKRSIRRIKERQRNK